MSLQYMIASRAEDNEIGALCEKCLNTPAEYFIKRLRNDPTVGPNGRLIARDGKRIVSNVNWYSFKLSFGAAEVGAGGIANVSTDPEYRGKGAATRLMEEAHRHIDEEGLPLAILGTGIHPFYERLGYAVWERAETRLLALKLPPARGNAKKFDLKQDITLLMELKTADRARFIGCLLRPEALWNAQPAWNRWFPAEDQSLGLLEHSGRAYARMALEGDRTAAAVLDFAVRPRQPGAVRSLAAAVMTELCSRGVKSLRIPEPCRDLVEAMGEHAKARQPQPNRSFMLRIMSLRRFLEALAPELLARAAAARLTAGTVGIRHGAEDVTLRLATGKIDVTRGISNGQPFASLEPARWVELFMGVKRFSSQPFARSSRVGEKEINMLEGLFPRRDNLFWEADNF